MAIDMAMVDGTRNRQECDACLRFPIHLRRVNFRFPDRLSQYESRNYACAGNNDHSKSPTTLNIPWIMDAQLEIVYGAIAEVHIPASKIARGMYSIF